MEHLLTFNLCDIDVNLEAAVAMCCVLVISFVLVSWTVVFFMFSDECETGAVNELTVPQSRVSRMHAQCKAESLPRLSSISRPR